MQSEEDQHARMADQKESLIFKKPLSPAGLVSVARFGDISYEHVPVRWFTALQNDKEVLEDFEEIGAEKVESLEIISMVAPLRKTVDMQWGNCPHHPNLMFYARFHALVGESKFSWEKDPKKWNKNYPWQKGAIYKSMSFALL